MVRSSATLLFTALLSVLWQRRRLQRAEWIGAVIIFVSQCVVVAACLVNTANTEHAYGTLPQELIGIALVLAGQFTQSLQSVVEEKLFRDLGLLRQAFRSACTDSYPAAIP